jgi:predicted TPR repeat methyltransferase
MDSLLSADAAWDQVLQSGREDLRRGLEFTGCRLARTWTAVDVGCGIGRMTQALAEQCGRVIGVDVSEVLLAEAMRHNPAESVRFERLTGPRLRLSSPERVDIVFAYEVFYLLPPPLLTTYFRDSWSLLEPGGCLVFQMNLNPVVWKTHLAWIVRRGLSACGIRHWRGQSTKSPRRYAWQRDRICELLVRTGFEAIEVSGDHLRQTWFMARKPSRPREP